MSRSVAILGALLGLGLAPVAASPRFTFREYTNYCTTGALVTCASSSVSVWSTSQGSVIVIRFQNRQGSDYGFDNSGGSSMDFFTMTHRNQQWYGVPYPLPTGLPLPTGPWLTTVGDVGRLGQAPDIWDASLDLGWMSVWNPAGLGKGVFGCDPRPIDPDAPPLEWGANGYSGALVTCPRDGLDGWVQMAIVVDIPSTAADWDLTWSMSSNWDRAPYGTWCNTADRSSCVSVTPEPVTMSLLATGLAGVGGAGAWRRRRQVTPSGRSGGASRTATPS